MEAIILRIMVTVPEDPAGREALARQAARLHAEAIRGQLEGLRCPAAQKMAALHQVIRANQSQNGTIRGIHEREMSEL